MPVVKFHNVGELKMELRPGENKILEVLEKSVYGLSFSEILNETNLSRPIVARYLKRLWKENLIDRNIDNRRYRLTEKGRRLLLKRRIINETEVKLQEFLEMDVMVEPKLKGKVEVFLWLDKQHKEKFDTITKNADAALRDVATRFVDGLKFAIAKAYGVSLDFDATLLLHFDGKKQVL